MRSILIATLLIGGCGIAVAEPFFKGYPAGQVYSGRHASPDLRSRDTYNFRTRIRDAAKRPANFAAEYSIQTWGCGTGCEQGVAVNIRTGAVSLLPSIEWDSEDTSEDDHFSYKLNSTLLAATGRMGDDRGKWEYLYRMDRAGLVFLSKSQLSADLQHSTNDATPVSPTGQRDLPDGKIYAAFLCTWYQGRPDLNQCSQQSFVTYPAKEDCQKFLDESRSNPISSKLEGDGHMDSGVRWHRAFKCMSRAQTWSDAD